MAGGEISEGDLRLLCDLRVTLTLCKGLYDVSARRGVRAEGLEGRRGGRRVGGSREEALRGEEKGNKRRHWDCLDMCLEQLYGAAGSGEAPAGPRAWKLCGYVCGCVCWLVKPFFRYTVIQREGETDWLTD